MQYHLYGKILRNLELYIDAQEIGFEYILNPDTQELHRVDPQSFWGSHNLEIADLEKFIGLTNVGILPIHKFKDGMEVPIYDLQTRGLIGTYRINKCGHCFPSAS